MMTIRNLIWLMLGRVVPGDEVLKVHGPTLLHLSDTPTAFYPELKRLLALLKPTWIIHTGDLADDLKLQMFPRLIGNYERELVKLMGILNESSADEILLIPGNHDNVPLVRKYAGRAEVYENSVVKSYEGKVFSCAHYFEAAAGTDLSKSADYLLFGHNLSQGSQLTAETRALNGIEAMHLIDLVSGTVYEIPYPPGTNSARLNRKRTHL